MLLDAGEGCVGQLWRCFGNEGRRRILETLSVVIISHFHADHHLGLLKLLRECRVQRPERPLTIIAPAQMRHWLEEYYVRRSKLFIFTYSDIQIYSFIHIHIHLDRGLLQWNRWNKFNTKLCVFRLSGIHHLG